MQDVKRKVGGRQEDKQMKDCKKHEETVRKKKREMTEWETYRGYDRNNTNRKLVSTTEENHISALSNHLCLSLCSSPLCLLPNLQHFPLTYFRDNKSGQTQFYHFY